MVKVGEWFTIAFLPRYLRSVIAHPLPFHNSHCLYDFFIMLISSLHHSLSCYISFLGHLQIDSYNALDRRLFLGCALHKSFIF